MATRLQVKVVTPLGEKVDLPVASITASSQLGEFCMLPNHRPILSVLVAGRMIVEKVNGTKDTFVIDRGFLEGGPDHVQIITERCLTLSEVDKTAVAAELKKTYEQLDKLPWNDPNRPPVEAELAWLKAVVDFADISTP